ncbi:MAG: metallophosphoesterase [Desulfosudaceae bacterium]
MKKTMHLFGIILISLVTLMHIYVFWRAGSVPVISQYLPKSIIILLGATAWTIFLTGLVYGHGSTGTLARFLDAVAMNWMGILFLMLVCLLAVDLLTGFGYLLPGLAGRLRGLALLTGLILSAAAFWQGTRPPVVVHYPVAIDDLPAAMEGTVLVALSDLHINSHRQGQWLNEIVDRVHSLEPDLVVLLGDILEGHGEDRGPSGRKIRAILNRLTAPLGVWAVLGNHEFYGGLHKNRALNQATGLRWLRNSWVEPRPGLILAGVDDLTVNRQPEEKKRLLRQTLRGRPAGAVTVLLSHTPDGISTVRRSGVDLMLCGHTHGGQIWPFGYLVKLRYPFLKGLYEAGATKIIVSTGTGTWGPRLRLWRPNEILRITLHHQDVE